MAASGARMIGTPLLHSISDDGAHLAYSFVLRTTNIQRLKLDRRRRRVAIPRG